MKKLGFILLLIIIGFGVAIWLNPELLSWLRKTTGTESTTTKVYKWQDKDGTWHVTDNPPPPGTHYQEQEYLHDTNVLPTIKSAPTPAQKPKEK